MSEPDPYAPRRRRAFLLPVLGLLAAFVLGIALTLYAVRRSTVVATWAKPAIVAAPAAPPIRLAPLVAPAAPKRAPADADTAEKIAEMESRLNLIEDRATAASGDADRAEGLLIAFAVRRALDRGQPLGFLEGMLRDRFGAREAAAVAMVISASQRPLTLGQLQEGFTALAPSLTVPGKKEDWWSGVRRELSGLFVVRRADQPSVAPDRTLSRAERALEQGQVATAAAEVARLPGASSATGWLALARRYVLAHAALDRLETTALLTSPADMIVPHERTTTPADQL